MLKRLAVLFVILGSSAFAQWEKEYVKDEFGVATKNYYLVHKSHDDSPSMLLTKGNLVVQFRERHTIYTSSLVNETIKVTDEKGNVHEVEATILMDVDNSTPYSVLVSRKNKTMMDLMKNNNVLVFELGKKGQFEKHTVSFHDFGKVYEEAQASNFRDEK